MIFSGCKDEIASITCQILKNRYGCGTIEGSCRLTCGKCTKCPTPPAPCTNGRKSSIMIQFKTADFYFDEVSARISVVSNINLIITLFISDCKDNNKDCSNWKKKGYCKTSSKYYTFMENECPLSCGICELCPIPAPKNTALPPPAPTPRACSPSGNLI